MPRSRPTRRPAANFSSGRLPVFTLEKLAALRVRSDARPPGGFRVVTSHRFSHPDAPGGLMYLGEDLETCLWECFGDQVLNPGAKVARGKWLNSRVSVVNARRPLSICDLTDLRTRRQLRLDLPALNNTDISIPQEWGLAIQSHPEQADGLFYPSRFTGGRCLVLFDRPKTVANLKSKKGNVLAEIAAASEFLTRNMIHLV